MPAPGAPRLLGNKLSERAKPRASGFADGAGFDKAIRRRVVSTETSGATVDVVTAHRPRSTVVKVALGAHLVAAVSIIPAQLRAGHRRCTDQRTGELVLSGAVAPAMITDVDTLKWLNAQASSLSAWFTSLLKWTLSVPEHDTSTDTSV